MELTIELSFMLAELEDGLLRSLARASKLNVALEFLNLRQVSLCGNLED